MFYGTGIGFAARGLNSAKRYMHCREPTKRRCSMNAYTVSRLALDAGVSVHIVRDYLLRGLLRPVACTTGGYGLFDDAALQRLCFVWAAFEAGIGLAHWRGCAGRWMRRTAMKLPRSLLCCVSSSNAGAKRWPIWKCSWPAMPTAPAQHAESLP